jgi:UDP-3-O-[3-hydroxymyristoyl] glucosamine N-acyltransferase
LAALEDAVSSALCPLFHKNALNAAPALPGAVLADGRNAEAALQAGVKGALVHETPVRCLAALIDIFYPAEESVAGVHPTASVHPDTRIHSTAYVGPKAVIEAGVDIGEGSVIEAGAVICKGTVIGRNVRIGPNAVIGYEGFGFIPSKSGPVKIRQVGRVIIDDEVEIGACACVDRGTLGATRIGRGTKIDNLVQVGHNARIGRSVILAGQVGIAGSAIIEDGVLMGGQAGVADHLIVGENAKIAAKSGVTGNVPKNAIVAGYPAVPRVQWLRFFAKKEGRTGRT